MLQPIDGDHIGNHRFNWEEYLTDALVERLSTEQKRVLMLGEPFEIDPQYHGERERERGRVRWGTSEELLLIQSAAAGNARM